MLPKLRSFITLILLTACYCLSNRNPKNWYGKWVDEMVKIWWKIKMKVGMILTCSFCDLTTIALLFELLILVI